MITYTTGDTVCPLRDYFGSRFWSVCVCACVLHVCATCVCYMWVLYVCAIFVCVRVCAICVCACVCASVCDILCRLAAGVFNDTTEFQNEAR